MFKKSICFGKIYLFLLVCLCSISKGNRNINNKRVFQVADLSKVKEIHSIAMMIILIESEL